LQELWVLIRWTILDALLKVYYEDEVKIPDRDTERELNSEVFAKKCGFASVVGSIDGLLVRIRLPRNVGSARAYLCYIML
jgi:hypothetical protein